MVVDSFVLFAPSFLSSPGKRDGLERDTWSHASLADVQRASAVPGGTPLFETILIFENYPVAGQRTAANRVLTVRDVEAREPNNYALTFVVTPGDTQAPEGRLSLKIMYDAGRFDRFGQRVPVPG